MSFSVEDLNYELELHKCSLMFMIKLPSRAQVFDMLSKIFTRYVQRVKDKQSNVNGTTKKIFYQAFDDLTQLLLEQADLVGNELEEQQMRLTVLRLQVSFIEVCLKLSQVEKAQEVSELIEKQSLSSVSSIIARLLSITFVLYKLGHEETAVSNGSLEFSTLLKDIETIHKLEGGSAEFDLYHVVTVCQCMYQIVQGCGNKVSQKIKTDTTTVLELRKCCDILFDGIGTCERLMSKVEDEEQRAKLQAEFTDKLQTFKCQAYTRKLQFILFQVATCKCKLFSTPKICFV